MEVAVRGSSELAGRDERLHVGNEILVLLVTGRPKSLTVSGVSATRVA